MSWRCISLFLKVLCEYQNIVIVHFFAESNGRIMLNIISRVFHFHHRYKKLQSYYCLLNTTRESYAQYDKKMLEKQFIFLELLWYTHISTEFWKYAPTKKSKQSLSLTNAWCVSVSVVKMRIRWYTLKTAHNSIVLNEL